MNGGSRPDDDVVAYLMGDPSGELSPADLADLDDLRALLADTATWAEPGAALEDHIVAAITTEAQSRPLQTEATPATVPAPSVAPTAAPVAAPTVLRPKARRRWAQIAVAAAVVTAGVVVGAETLRGPGEGPTFGVQLAAEGAPRPVGSGTLTRTDVGWRVQLDTTGLDAVDGTSTYYQAWLKNDAGVLVPIGTFDKSGPVTLWAGVSPRDFPTVTVTIETVGEDQGSSGRRVLAGRVAIPAKPES